jgi:DNA-directed RNA polymerase subunit E"
MSTRKVCKNCKIFVKGDQCPICKGNQFTTTWKGRVHVLDASKSEIAKKMGIAVKGEYAIRAR